MTELRAGHPIIHFVGSIPLQDAETVFRTLAESAGSCLRRLPDGETGIRKAYQAAEKLGVWRKSPRSQLETRDPFQLNQWVTATLRGRDCSENSTDRLFPQPARFSLPVLCSKRKGRSSSVAAIGFTACAEGVKGAARRRNAAWISQRCDARARGAGLRNLPRCPIPLSVSS
jgi:hypothetical protein